MISISESIPVTYNIPVHLFNEIDEPITVDLVAREKLQDALVYSGKFT